MKMPNLDQQLLRAYYIICRKVDIHEGNKNIILLHFVLLSLAMAALSATFYKVTSVVFLFISLCLVIYILASEFLRVKSMHEDLKIACNIPQ